MSDLDNLMALKKLLENKGVAPQDDGYEREKRFMADATHACMGGDASSKVQGYNPEALAAFLDLPGVEVQRRMGGEWAAMDPLAFDSFAYTMKQKIQKSASLIDWKS